uniref:Uncharacterized protein n=1 Tax=Steinernema glaseri TaxID=37863 RepID=A0A1I7YM56_9BILA
MKSGSKDKYGGILSQWENEWKTPRIDAQDEPLSTGLAHHGALLSEQSRLTKTKATDCSWQKKKRPKSDPNGKRG